MSVDGTNNTGGGNGDIRHRRGSISQAAMSNLFQRGNTNANGQYVNDSHRRRLSVTTLGLSGSLPNNPAMNMRRGSMSTNSNNSDSIDENAIEDDDMNGSAKTAPTTPFARRMSLGGPAMRGYRPGGSPGNDQQGFNWSEQLRSRAESSVSGARPSFSLASTSPPRQPVGHDRTKSVSDMPAPPAQAAAVKSPPPARQERPKPDAFQERILKGDFYMD
ncbi:hypothetical protein N3K66_002382 [Trichothecium roseum]|uniref:Uncharacterized protein n=1 Tax=Trichothecium roseum TaxID=47278 RepID=A0ACC0VB27_9HYPO|nr:hypothetical protein N3K66_002382 [Trichothecium roseum]